MPRKWQHTHLRFITDPDGDDGGGGENGSSDNNDGGGSETPPEKRYTQAELESRIGERVARERAKYRGYNELKAKAEKFDQLEAQNKPDAQREAEAIVQAQKREAEANAVIARYQAASEHGVIGQDIDLIGSGDEETLNARAKRLGELLAAERERDELKAQLERGRQQPQETALPPRGASGSVPPAVQTPSVAERVARMAAARGWTGNTPQ